MSAVSSSLYALWAANGKPERIGYAATVGYVDALVRQVATVGQSCAGGAMGLYESNGSLYGRWCGVSGVSLESHTQNRYTASADAHTTPSPFNFSPVTITNTYSTRSWVVITGTVDDYLLVNGAVVATTFGGPFPQVIFNLDGGASFVLAAKNRSPMYPSDGVNYDVVVTINNQADIRVSVPLVTEVSISSAGVPWITASTWSRSGQWVRRKSWGDSNMMLRHEAGTGSTPSVAVLKSTTVTAARPVRNSEFGQAEFGALDWALKYPPTTGVINLTNAMIAVDAESWVLWKSSSGEPPVIIDPPPVDCPGCP